MHTEPERVGPVLIPPPAMRDHAVATRIDRALQGLTAAAVAATPGAAYAGITGTTADGHVYPRAATDPILDWLTTREGLLGQGPHVDLDPDTEIRIADMRIEQRWPLYCATAAGTGIGAMASVAVPAGGGRCCAIDLYARAAHAFTRADEELLAVFAEQAAAVLAAADYHHVRPVS